MSDVYAVVTHSKYLVNQEQNSFHSVKKSSSGNKYMKPDLYIRKALLVTTKKNRFCYKGFQHSAFLNLFDEYSYMFSPNWGTPRPLLWKWRGGKKKKKKGGGGGELKCTWALLLSTATRYIDLENNASHPDFGFRDALFFSSVVHRTKSPIEKKKSYSYWNPSDYLWLAAVMH